MANITPNTAYQQKERAPKKLLLEKLFTDASVRIEPEEPQKVVVAGLAEARVQKEYPDTAFKRAIAVFKGEFAQLFKSALYSMIFTLPFIVIMAWFAGYFEEMVLGGTYNFMGGIGVGYNPGVTDSINFSVARLYWDVNAPVICMLAACLIFGALGLAGQFYCAKRCFYQNYYKQITRTYWMGFAKNWWKYLVLATIDVLIGLAMAVALVYLLQQQTLGTADAGAYCAVVFSWVIGLPLLTIPMATMSILTSYDLTFVQAIKNAIVLIANNAFVVAIVGAVSAVPLLVCISGGFISIIAYIFMALVGTTLLSLLWIAMGDRGMQKCHNRLVATKKTAVQQERKAQKKATSQNPYANGAVINTAPKQQKKKPQQVPYQNPKKKKKK